LIVNYEMNLLSLVSPWLDNNYPIQTKMLQYRISLSLPSKPGPEIRLLWFFLRGFSCSNSVATLSRHLYPAAVLEIHAWRSSCRFWSLGPWPMDMEGDVCYGSCDYEAPAFVFLASSARSRHPVPPKRRGGESFVRPRSVGRQPHATMRDETWQRKKEGFSSLPMWDVRAYACTGTDRRYTEACTGTPSVQKSYGIRTGQSNSLNL
jgi:hypothetical protein